MRSAFGGSTGRAPSRGVTGTPGASTSRQKSADSQASTTDGMHPRAQRARLGAMRKGGVPRKTPSLPKNRASAISEEETPTTRFTLSCAIST